MHIKTEWFTGQYPSFTVHLSGANGREPFISIKSCRIVDGSNGQFVSWPSRKMESGKYFNYVWGNDEFAAEVLRLARESLPKAETRTAAPRRSAPPTKATGGFDDMLDDVPF